MNAYFQHLLYYKSERKDLKHFNSDNCKIPHYNPLPKTRKKLLRIIIDGCLATRQNGLICHTLYNKTITMATRLSILAYCYGLT